MYCIKKRSLLFSFFYFIFYFLTHEDVLRSRVDTNRSNFPWKVRRVSPIFFIKEKEKKIAKTVLEKSRFSGLDFPISVYFEVIRHDTVQPIICG